MQSNSRSGIDFRKANTAEELSNTWKLLCAWPLPGVSVTSQEWFTLTARNWLQQFKFEDFSLYYINSLLLPKEHENRYKGGINQGVFSFLSPSPLLKQFLALIIHLPSINSGTKIFPSRRDADLAKFYYIATFTDWWITLREAQDINSYSVPHVNSINAIE